MKNVSKVAKMERELAEGIVLDAKDAREEIWAIAQQESLRDDREAGISYSPERVWGLIQVLAKKHNVAINYHH